MSSFQISYVYELVDKLSPVIKKIQNNIDDTANKVNKNAGKMGFDFDKLAQKVDKLGDRFTNLGKKLFIRTTVPLTLLGRSFVNAASNYNESINKVDVAFGKASQSVKDFANSAGKNFGIDRGSALDMAAMFGDMATGMGMAQEKAAGLATNLVGLAGDLASFKNIGIDQAQTALAAIFTGETESLKKLGIVMTQTNLQQFALTQGIRKKIEKMKQAELVLLRYNYVIAMSKNSLGDFTRTSEGYANQQRILASRWRDLSIQLGTILLPYALKFVKALASLIDKFQSLNPTTQKTIMLVAGLVAVISPLLIGLGFMMNGIVALIPVMGFLITTTLTFISVLKTLSIIFLANPLGLFIAGAVLLVVYWREIIELIYKAIDAFHKLTTIKLPAVWKDLKSMFNINDVIDLNANNNQSVTAGGTLDINLRSDKGTAANMSFWPSKKNFLDVGLNSIYSGG